MAKYDFDKVIDRHGTSCMKYDGYGHFESEYEDILPLWIADMDFATPVSYTHLTLPTTPYV